MGKAEDLATRFEKTNADFISAVQAVSDEEWALKASNDERPVGVVAHHVASAIPAIVQGAQGVAAGEKWPFDRQEQLDEWNSAHAAQNMGCAKSEVLDMLKQNGAAAAQAVRTMSDEQLSGPTVMNLIMNQRMNAGDVIEYILIGHPGMHIQSIRDSAR